MDLSKQILPVEQILLSKGQLPSVFFRFPGLMSNENLIKQLRHCGLIPVGSNAWLARGEQADKGDIILVHGNSNEHKGIELMLSLLKSPSLTLLPLQNAVIDD